MATDELLTIASGERAAPPKDETGVDDDTPPPNSGREASPAAASPVCSPGEERPAAPDQPAAADGGAQSWQAVAEGLEEAERWDGGRGRGDRSDVLASVWAGGDRG